MKKFYFYLYQVILILIAPLVLVYLLIENKKREGGLRFIKQRLGFDLDIKEQYDIWIHAASLGEVITTKPIIAQLLEENPEWKMLITTNTATGARAVRKLQSKQVTHRYLPLDYPWMISRFLDKVNASRFIIVETELWPNLFTQTTARGLAPTIVNGRLSPKTVSNKVFYPLFAYCLNHCKRIYTRSKNDLEKFITLGADSDKLLSVGNIKFSAAATQTYQGERLINNTYVLAASTHDNEEQQLCESLLTIAERHLLVIVPRHIERKDQILEKLAPLELNIAVRSHGDDITDETDVYLADTIGEMTAFMAHAEWVFMGGSLVPHGGQNMLEAAQLGKAIICGTHTFNFEDEMGALQAVEGVLIAKDNDELVQHIEHLQAAPEHTQSLGQNAADLIKNNAGISRHYVKLLRNQWRNIDNDLPAR